MTRCCFIFLLALAMLCVACPSPGTRIELPTLTQVQKNDVELIHDVLNDVQRGIETRRIYRVLAHVSRTYHDADGRDYNAIRVYLRTFLNNYRDIKITRPRPRITVQGNKAQALETYGSMAKPMNQSDAPINQQGQVAVQLEKLNGVWLITEWSAI